MIFLQPVEELAQIASPAALVLQPPGATGNRFAVRAARRGVAQLIERDDDAPGTLAARREENANQQPGRRDHRTDHADEQEHQQQ